MTTIWRHVWQKTTGHRLKSYNCKLLPTYFWVQLELDYLMDSLNLTMNHTPILPLSISPRGHFGAELSQVTKSGTCTSAWTRDRHGWLQRKNQSPESSQIKNFFRQLIGALIFPRCVNSTRLFKQSTWKKMYWIKLGQKSTRFSFPSL